MMKNISLIQQALSFGATASGYNMKKAQEYIKAHALDKRYKLFAICGTACWTYNETGKVKYAGREYEYQQSHDGYKVKLATW